MAFHFRRRQTWCTRMDTKLLSVINGMLDQHNTTTQTKWLTARTVQFKQEVAVD